MRSRAQVAGLVLVLFAADRLWAAEDSPGERKPVEASASQSKPAQGLGQLVIQDAQSGTFTRLNVARYHVNVVLQPPVALVQIDQSFYNPSNRQEEGTFVFNLPRGASVSRFAMYVARDQLIEGELIERQQAAGIYQSIVNQRRDPAILEQIGENLFKMRVFPIFPRDVKRILLDFTLPLEADHGEYRFRLPLLSDLQPIWDFRLTGAIGGPTRLDSLACPSHADIAFKRAGDDRVTFELKRSRYKPETDFAVRFVQQQAGAIALRTYLAERLPPRRDAVGKPVAGSRPSERATYFMASVKPDAPGRHGPALKAQDQKAQDQKAQRAAAPADVLVLADTSSGMRDCAAARQAVRTVVEGLRPLDRVRLMCLDVGARPLHEGWISADGNRQLLDRFDQEFCLGGTDLSTGFREALATFDEHAKDRRRLVIYVGDGQDTLGTPENEAFLRGLGESFQNARAALMAVIARRDDAGRPLLESLCRSTGGLLFDVTGGPESSRGLTAWLLAGAPSPDRIVKCEVEGADPDELFYPTAWLPGEELRILGRTTATDRVRLELTVLRDGKPATVKQDLVVDPKHDDVFVGRLWAQRQLDRLRPSELPRFVPATPSVANTFDPVRDEIVALSQEWSLLSPYTAFLVLESEADYARWNIDRQQRRRYWKPADALAQAPLPADWVALAKAEEKTADGKKVESEAERFARIVRSAREALNEGRGLLAQGLLRQVRDSKLSAESKEYAELTKRAETVGRMETLLGAMGPHRRLLEPSVGVDWFRSEPSVMPPLGAAFRVSDDFLKRHPRTAKLLQPVTVAPREMTVDDLVLMLADATGGNAMIDRKALNDVGINSDTATHFRGWGKMSLRNYARFLLAQMNLVLLEEPHRLLVTTPEQAEARLTTDVYPLADLIYTDRVADPPLLMNPYLDVEASAEKRLREKLRRPMSVDFKQTPLGDVAEHFARFLDDAVVMDRRALNDVGIDADTPVTAAWRDVPAKESLQWILKDLDLTCMIDREAMVITTSERADSHLPVRVVSGRGVLYEYGSPAGGQFDGGEPGRVGRGGRGFGGMMGGGFGGLGGMGGGSFGGMGGGTFGGMGAGMGGMGAMGGTFGGPAGGGGNAGVSSGGDPTSTPETPAETPGGAAGATSLLPDTAGMVAGGGVQADRNSLTDTITSTIAPTMWDSVGGPGSIGYFLPTLDIVFAQTDSVHEEVEKLFERLRRLPSAKKGARLLEVGPTNLAWADETIDLITSVVRPSTWDTVGGSGSIQRDEERMALIVAQTQQVHEEITSLLTRLRRSRYAALRSGRPWEQAPTSPDGPAFGPPGSADFSADLRAAKLPPPKPEAVEALKARRAAAAGTWKWQREDAAGQAQETIELCRTGDTLEIRGPFCTVRTQGDAAAVAWPELLLVEHGNWGASIRCVFDAWLPWLPHRSNEELAQWFDVAPLDGERLRLVPRGLPPEGDTCLEAAFDKKNGLPLAWESHLQGKLTGRLRFADRAEFDGTPLWRSVTLEDAAGKTLVRWKLIEASLKPPTIPDMTAGWQGYVQSDRRAEKPAVDAEFHEALAAMQRGQWAAAFRQLEAAAKAHPSHPLLAFLQAQCSERDRSLAERKQVVAALRQVAQSDATFLTRSIAEGFPWLDPAQRYEILSLMPRQKRTAADWDRLVSAAVAAGKVQEALGHAEAALAAKANDGRDFERHKARVTLLLQLARTREAVEAAQRWAAEPGVTAEQLATMAEALARHGSRAPADALFVKALATPNLSAQERFALLRRRADVGDGLPRWRLLLEAASLQPADSPPRADCLATVLAELGQPAQAEAAATLAGEAKDATVKSRLLLRQAELTADLAKSAELAWQVFQDGRLPDDRLLWACQRWSWAEQPERAIRALEQRLRSRAVLAAPRAQVLEDAYRASGRTRDARRAATSDPAPETVQQSSGGMRSSGSGFF